MRPRLPCRAACAPSPAAAAAESHLAIELLDDPSFRFTIRAGQTVGRTEKADIILAGVPKLDWISGAHARFLRRGEQWYIQHIGATNFIKVDGEMFQGPQEVPIHDGSILLLSLTSFRVRHRRRIACSSAQPAERPWAAIADE